MKRDNLSWCQYLGTCIYPGGDEARIVLYEDGSIAFIPVVGYMGTYTDKGIKGKRK